MSDIKSPQRRPTLTIVCGVAMLIATTAASWINVDDINSGPNCVRFRASALAAPAPEGSAWDWIRRNYLTMSNSAVPPHMKVGGPLDYIASACNMDNVFVKLIIDDEIAHAGLVPPQQWDLPKPAPRCGDWMDPNLARRVGCPVPSGSKP